MPEVSLGDARGGVTAPLGFDQGRYLRLMQGAVEGGRTLASSLRRLAAGGGHEVVFLGTGGVNLLMEPALRLLRSYSTFPVHMRRAAEETAFGFQELGPGSVVILPSLSGTTAETLEIAHQAREHGAKLVGLVGAEGTSLGELCAEVIVNPAADDTSSESYYLQTMLGLLGLSDDPGCQLVSEELALLPEVLLEVKRAFDPQARRHAEHLAASDWHIFTAAGPSWTEAHYFAMCILEEMQWIRTRPVNASDFFHGTLELVEEGVSVVVLKDESQWRPLADRVEKFLLTRTDKVDVIDAAVPATARLSSTIRSIAGPIVLAAQLERVAAHLELIRNHPLTTRRYYKRVEY